LYLKTPNTPELENIALIPSDNPEIKKKLHQFQVDLCQKIKDINQVLVNLTRFNINKYPHLFDIKSITSN